MLYSGRIATINLVRDYQIREALSESEPGGIAEMAGISETLF
jgi:hypothetical protein